MNKMTFTGDGLTKQYEFAFPFFKTDDIRATVGGQSVQFSVQPHPAGIDADIPFDGGLVIFHVAPTENAQILIYRRIKLERQIDYQKTLPIASVNLNRDLNFCIESLKDFQDILSDIPNISDMQNIVTQIEIAQELLENIGDMPTSDDLVSINDAITSVNTAVAAMNAAVAALQTKSSETIDYVVASAHNLSGTNYTNGWYRKYKSGWIEQGGTSTVAAVVFPIQFSNTNYMISAISYMFDANAGTISICYSNKTTSGVGIQVRWNGTGKDNTNRDWFAAGY